MNPGPRWGFDIDSVVGDLSGLLERVAWEEFGVALSRSQFTRFQLEECLPYPRETIMTWIARALDPDWTMRMEPYPGAVELLTELAGAQPLLFVTARSEAKPISDWLAARLARVPGERIRVAAVGHEGLKHPVLLGWGVSHFVDDRWEICEEISRHGIVPVLFRQPWNTDRRGFAAVDDWGQIRALMAANGNGGH
jgi:hypothetical protein